jgi:hypothetical protein
MKQRKNRGNLRKRATEDETAAPAEDDQTAVVRKAKQQRGEPLAFSTKKDGPQDVAVTYASTAAALAARDESATRALETETEFDRDARWGYAAVKAVAMVVVVELHAAVVHA